MSEDLAIDVIERGCKSTLKLSLSAIHEEKASNTAMLYRIVVGLDLHQARCKECEKIFRWKRSKQGAHGRVPD